MATLPWNPLKKVTGSLNAKPMLTEGLVSTEDDRAMEITYVKLQEMEEQMRQIKSQLAPAPEEKQKTVREVDMFASGGNNVDSKHLRSPVKVNIADFI